MSHNIFDSVGKMPVGSLGGEYHKIDRLLHKVVLGEFDVAGALDEYRKIRGWTRGKQWKRYIEALKEERDG